MMKTGKMKAYEHLIYSAVGLAALALLLVAFNFLASKAAVRADLTDGDIYTLSAGTKKIHDAVDSPWLKYALDTGNFFHLEDQYAEMETFLDDLAVLHAKTYLGGSRVGVPPIDYDRVNALLKRINYNGYVSIEFEGHAHPQDGIADGIATVRKHLVDA